MESDSNSSGGNNNPDLAGLAQYFRFDFSWIFNRIQDVMINPKGCWAAIKTEGLSTKEILGRYVVPLLSIAAVCLFIGKVMIGIPMPLIGTFRLGYFTGLMLTLLTFAASVASFFVASFLVEKFAPKFGTQLNQDQAMRLVAFAATPILISGLLRISQGPPMDEVSYALWAYSAYLLYVGMQAVTDVSEAKLPQFFAASLLSISLALLIIFGVVASIFQPSLPSTPYIKDMQDLERNIQRMLPGAK